MSEQLLDAVGDQPFFLGHPLLDELNDFGRLILAADALHVEALQRVVDRLDLHLIELRYYLLSLGQAQRSDATHASQRLI